MSVTLDKVKGRRFSILKVVLPVDRLATLAETNPDPTAWLKALASEGKASASLLSVLPVLLVSLMALTRPSFYTSKFSDPIFWPVATGIIVLYGIGQIMFYRIVNFKY